MDTEKDPLDDFATVLDLAAHVLGNREQAVRWMETPSLHLGWKKPWEVALTPEGEANVRLMLKQLAYGVYI